MAEKWKCGVCGGINLRNTAECFECHSPRQEAEVTPDTIATGKQKQADEKRLWWRDQREKASNKPRWEYLLLPFKIKRGGLLGTSFDGEWIHDVFNELNSHDLLDELDAVGELGWELVNVMPNSNPVLMRSGGETTEWLFFFKRLAEREALVE